MKKIIFIILVLFLGITRVNALTEQEIELLDSDNKISLPMLISNNGATVSVYNVDNYSLYYQWKEISTDLYNSIDNKLEELNNLVKEANNYSSNSKPDVSDSEAVTTYNNRIREYKEQIDTLKNEYYTLYPSYPEEWLNADSSNKIYPPENAFTGKKPFVIYVKLVDNSSNKNIYDVAMLQLDGSKKTAEISNTEDSSNNNEVTNTNSSKTTSNPSNPKTLDVNPVIIIISLISLIFIIVISKNKLKKLKKVIK